MAQRELPKDIRQVARGRSTHLWNESHTKRLEPSRGVMGLLQFGTNFGHVRKLRKQRPQHA
ncbi:unnamed protein product [Eruca vesicaria subsp. sativa]|uniref:Uncharacterized protein n=1 Tax=Eruca vesicaria subsp. sativa TaxID=29727 RepID=A0ABC8K852_ERUVS|nr:unnamed protein product [Eruca vesicaria subsp. sativa]